jgi:transposase-like protein
VLSFGVRAHHQHMPRGSAAGQVTPELVRRWMRQADIDERIRDGLMSAEQAGVVQLRHDKRRLEMETGVVRGPARSCATRSSTGSPTYNRRRRQRALGKLTPVEYETRLRLRGGAGISHN